MLVIKYQECAFTCAGHFVRLKKMKYIKSLKGCAHTHVVLQCQIVNVNNKITKKYDFRKNIYEIFK